MKLSNASLLNVGLPRILEYSSKLLEYFYYSITR